MKKSIASIASIATAAVLLASSAVPVISSANATVDNQSNRTVKTNSKANVESRATNSTKVASTRVSASGCYKRYLLPITKQTFKQNRRKELNKSRKKRNKQS